VTEQAQSWRNEDDHLNGLQLTGAAREALGLNSDGSSGGSSEHSAQEAAAASLAPRARSRIAVVIALLQREQGAAPDEMVEATGWLPHTTRAALTGLREKGEAIVREKRGEATCYRIAAGA